MTSLAEMLSLIVGRPVLDRTNLHGSYNFTLEFSMEELGGLSAAESPNAQGRPSVFTLVQGIGLKLVSRKAPLEVIVIETGNKIPAEN
jgi:uncharacterized protein (TIGR03435 family)